METVKEKLMYLILQVFSFLTQRSSVHVYVEYPHLVRSEMIICEQKKNCYSSQHSHKSYILIIIYITDL